jgi:hypothetical protein
MPFYFNHADKKLNLEELPLDRWIAIEAESGQPWPEVLTGKCIGDAKVAKAVIGQACGHLGIEVPALTLKSVVELITFDREETLPTEFVDGMPDPKATDSAPVTT